MTNLKTCSEIRASFVLTAAACITVLPVVAGDLGLYDEKLAGIGNALQEQRYDQREFIDREGSKIIFTSSRLEIVLSEKRSRWVKEKNQEKLGNIDFDEAAREAYLTPEQVISFNYQTTNNAGILFKIFYRTRAGGRSLASLQITDENSGKSFYNTFLLWLNGSLSTIKK